MVTVKREEGGKRIIIIKDMCVTHRFLVQVETSACHQDLTTRPVIPAQKLRVSSEK